MMVRRKNDFDEKNMKFVLETDKSNTNKAARTALPEKK